eukprot:180639-Chlamydomonas_euryale.AAC.3
MCAAGGEGARGRLWLPHQQRSDRRSPRRVMGVMGVMGVTGVTGVIGVMGVMGVTGVHRRLTSSTAILIAL